ncbi:protein PTST homolog 3, chloroplastic isoform X2 [Juglans regia]|nr:protein PTST homolog 3, chloroplastic isoform X2 [Juglans regia]
MATLFHFPCFLSLYYRNLLLAPQQQQQLQQQHKLNWATHEPPPRKKFTFCACSTKKSTRGSRKVKSNAELCNDIREFVTALGLPEDHVPLMKELSQHGRKDLANIVRRRGYKLIRELISNSTKSDSDGPNPKKSLDTNQDEIGDHEHILTGQDKNVNNAVSSSTDVSIVRNYSDGLSSDSDFNSDNFRGLTVESSVNSFSEGNVSYKLRGHNKKVNDVAEDVSMSNEVSAIESSPSINQHLNSDDHSWRPIGSSVNSFLEEKPSSNLQVQDEKVNDMVEESSAVLSMEERPSHSLVDQHKKTKNANSGDDSCMPKETSANSSFEEKVDRFIQNGDLDMIDDISYGLLNESGNEEGKKFVQPQNFSVPPGEEHSEHMRNGGNAAVTLNDQMLTSKHVAPDVIVGTQSLRDDLLSSEELMTAELDKDLDTESGKREKQAEINQLRFMLRQKELELSRLKEQIKKEKLSLSDLQTKAETEIRKAQKFILKKDAELQGTEESLSGLKEVQIQFHGDGEIVEVSGSFNGWHHHIKLDPQPPCSTMGPVTSR